MPTSKTSRTNRPDHAFRSRFDQAEDLFPLRQYLRIREELVRRSITSVVLIAFAVALAMFGRSMHRMIARHGDGGATWLEPTAWTLVAVSLLLTARRIWRNVNAVLELRTELNRYKSEVDDLRIREKESGGSGNEA